jgi:hypothetical protein
MKKNPTLLFFTVILAGIVFSSCGTAQTTAETDQKAYRIKRQIEFLDFRFRATTAIPMQFQPVQLTPEYDLKVTKDTVKAFLPYFGRAYKAPMNPREGGIQFSSTRFEYSVTKGKKPGNWKVKILTLDTDRRFTLFLNIWQNCSAQLSVTDPDRQSISFQGYIDE